VTFLMVFLIQRSQNKDALAVHLKLNELVAAIQGASNRLIDVEALTEDERRGFTRFMRPSRPTRSSDIDLGKSHSVERRTRSTRASTAARAEPPTPA